MRSIAAHFICLLYFIGFQMMLAESKKKPTSKRNGEKTKLIQWQEEKRKRDPKRRTINFAERVKKEMEKMRKKPFLFLVHSNRFPEREKRNR